MFYLRTYVIISQLFLEIVGVMGQYRIVLMYFYVLFSSIQFKKYDDNYYQLTLGYSLMTLEVIVRGSVKDNVSKATASTVTLYPNNRLMLIISIF